MSRLKSIFFNWNNLFTILSVLVAFYIYIAQSHENQDLSNKLSITRNQLKLHKNELINTKTELEKTNKELEETRKLLRNTNNKLDDLESKNNANTISLHRQSYNSWLAIHNDYAKSYGYSKVYFRNKCSEKIEVSYCFMDYEENWVTMGWKTINPGEKKYLISTNNSNFYYYAKSSSYNWSGKNDEGNIYYPVSNNSFFFRINHQEIPFSKQVYYHHVDLKDNRTFTQNLSCN